MKNVCRLATVVLALGVASPASSADVDKSVLAAAEKTLSSLPANFFQVEPAAAQQQLENAKPFLLDVRETSELSKGKIAGSKNIPIRDLPKMLAQLPENKAAPILTYCQVGYRGGMSTLILRMLGYTNVTTIKGGLDAWQKAGLPVEKA